MPRMTMTATVHPSRPAEPDAHDVPAGRGTLQRPAFAFMASMTMTTNVHPSPPAEPRIPDLRRLHPTRLRSELRGIRHP
ncbi:hypothetical protein ABZU32_33865 [Sphaerisporangium sp. NPDC005288]|uniref:hypothetical protein n=1 Tax=Sphaerisporangium sp. NPDC005288 TaxID=3155114 RepID=UPI0033AF0261